MRAVSVRVPQMDRRVQRVWHLLRLVSEAIRRASCLIGCASVLITRGTLLIGRVSELMTRVTELMTRVTELMTRVSVLIAGATITFMPTSRLWERATFRVQGVSGLIARGCCLRVRYRIDRREWRSCARECPVHCRGRGA